MLPATRSRQFSPGDRVLILRPTSTHKLRAQWQGPYRIVERKGEVDYVVDVGERRKRWRTFHVNMLWEWHESKPVSLYIEEGPTDEEVDNVIFWENTGQEAPNINANLSGQQRRDMQQILSEYDEVFRPGRTHLTEHHVNVGHSNPVRQTPYRLPHAYRELVQEELREMEEDGIIEESNSEWASPIVLIPKKDGSLRLYVDYRRLNSVLEVDAYPMPRIDDLMDRLGGAKYLTTLDLTRGYWQVPVERNSRPLTAFTTPYGLYQFVVMPFGLKGAPATFQ